MTHTSPLVPITHKCVRKARWAASASLISTFCCLSAKNVLSHGERLHSVWGHLSKSVKAFIYSSVSSASDWDGGEFQRACIKWLCQWFIFFGTGRKVSKNTGGVLLTSKAQAQAIKMSYGMNTTLIQSQLLILDHFFRQECISWLGWRWWLSWIKATWQDKNRTGAQRGRVKWNQIKWR